MAMNVEAEIRDLKRRVSELEGSFGFLTVKAVHKDLLELQEETEERFERIDSKLAKMDGRFDKVDGRLDRDVRELRTDMPKIVK